jgi:hypothetical protein
MFNQKYQEVEADTKESQENIEDVEWHFDDIRCVVKETDGDGVENDAEEGREVSTSHFFFQYIFKQRGRGRIEEGEKRSYI